MDAHVWGTAVRSCRRTGRIHRLRRHPDGRPKPWKNCRKPQKPGAFSQLRPCSGVFATYRRRGPCHASLTGANDRKSIWLNVPELSQACGKRVRELLRNMKSRRNAVAVANFDFCTPKKRPQEPSWALVIKVLELRAARLDLTSAVGQRFIAEAKACGKQLRVAPRTQYRMKFLLALYGRDFRASVDLKSYRKPPFWAAQGAP
jgi:hypothetical protein